MERITWSPKIHPSKIWLLYQNEARGTVDEPLVEEVGFSLFHRCRSIWLVTRREVECPHCGTVYKLHEYGIWKLQPGPQPCPKPGCGWETTAREWHESWRHRDLLGTAAQPAMETFLDDYPKAHTTAQKMLFIDQLIHSFHISLRTGKSSRSFGNNLIAGSHDQVVELLDRLFTKDGGVDKENWRAEIDGMYSRRRGHA